MRIGMSSGMVGSMVRARSQLLIDPTQTIESLAVREGKSERSIRMTLR